MKNIVVFFCCCLLITSSVQGQNFEKWLEQWIEDGSNAFENVEQAYAKNGNEVCGILERNYGNNTNGIGHFFAHLEIASSKDNSRRELHTKFHDLKKQMNAMSFFKEWTYNEIIERYFGNINYKKEDNNNQYRCELALKSWEDYEAVMITIEYNGASEKEGKLAPNHDKLRKLTEADTTVLVASDYTFSQDIRAVFGETKGMEAFKSLLADAENDFKNIIGLAIAENIYSVKPNALNPTAQEPHQIIIDKGQMRTELHLRLIELYGAVGWRLDDGVRNALQKILGDDWNIETKISGEWKATLKNGKKHIQIVRRNKNNRDYLVVEVIKEPFRKYIEQYPQLLKGNCIEGNCVEGKGVFVTQESAYYDVRYEGEFKNGYYEGIGFVYFEYASKQNMTSFELDHYSNSKKRLLFMGNHQAGKRHGKGIAYAYAKYKDPYKNFREVSEYFQKDEQTGVFYYLFQEYDSDSLQSEYLCNFIYYNPNNRDAKIEQPFTTAFGQCISGDCNNGKGILKINGLGNYEGQFVNGKAQGKGILKMENSEWKSFEAFDGIPKYIRTVKLPQGISRLAAAKRNVWLLADNDCLEGNCYNGKGTKLRVSADRFRRYNVRYRGYVQTNFQNGIAEGQFKILPIDEPQIKVDGTFKNGKFDGTLTVQWASETTPRYEYYQNGKRVTKDGQDYREYLDEEIKKAQEAIAKRYEQAIAEGKRQAAARAEAERERKAIQQANKSKKQRKHSCMYCKTTGSVWETYYEKDCTIVYDYRYTSGKYYQTSTNCRDVKRGSYVICPVCSGNGWYWH